jgi:hypothetical protein
VQAPEHPSTQAPKSAPPLDVRCWALDVPSFPPRPREGDSALQRSKLFASCDEIFRSAAVPAAARDAWPGAWDCSHTARLPTLQRPGTGALRLRRAVFKVQGSEVRRFDVQSFLPLKGLLTAKAPWRSPYLLYQGGWTGRFPRLGYPCGAGRFWPEIRRFSSRNGLGRGSQAPGFPVLGLLVSFNGIGRTKVADFLFKKCLTLIWPFERFCPHTETQ